jgi:hypothetical protein
VADFFHLHSEVSELAQTPVVDWNALAEEIGARVRLEVPPVDAQPQGWAAHPRIWQFGLATATVLCAFLIVRQLPVIEERASQSVSQTEALGLEEVSEADGRLSIDLKTAVAAGERSNQPVAALQFGQPTREAQQTVGSDEQVREAKEAAAPATAAEEGALADRVRQDENFRAASGLTRAALPELEAQAAPPLASEPGQVGGFASPSDQPTVLSFAAPLQDDRASAEKVGASRARRSLAETETVRAAAQRAAAPPPPAPAALLPSPTAEADTAASQDRLTTARASTRAPGARQAQTANGRGAGLAELAQASKAEAPAELRRLETAALAKKVDADSSWSPERGFTVLPAALEDPAVDVGVAADGWISIRSVDASTSTITITDVYVP